MVYIYIANTVNPLHRMHILKVAYDWIIQVDESTHSMVWMETFQVSSYNFLQLQTNISNRIKDPTIKATEFICSTYNH